MTFKFAHSFLLACLFSLGLGQSDAVITPTMTFNPAIVAPTSCDGLSTLTDSPWIFDDNGVVGFNPQYPFPTNRALSILGEYVPGSTTFQWLFFAVQDGQKAECRGDTATPPKEVPFSTSGTTYPEGAWDLDLNGQKCQYTSQNNPGTLVCGDKTIACGNDPADTNPGDPNADKGEYDCSGKRRQPVFYCGPY